jgi:membrane protein implicated in regulation of membrane protease activity
MARAFFEMAAFLLLAGKIAQSDSVLNSIALYGMFGAAILSIGLVLEEVPLLPRVFALIAIVSLISWLLWWRLFSAGERSWIFQRWQRIASQLLKGRHYKNDIER